MNSSPNKIFGKEHTIHDCQSFVSKEVGSSYSIDIQSNSDNISRPVNEPNDFTISQEILAKLVESNDGSLPISEVLIALQTDVEIGICGDARDLDHRHKAFGSNLNFDQDYSSTDDDKAKNFQELIIEALKDSSIILLLCCALLSLVIGIKRNGLEEGLFDGVIIFLTILIVVNFVVICRYFKARRMLIKNLSRGKISIGVIRCGKLLHIAVHEVVVGDILWLKSGDVVPADGLLIQGNSSLKIDDGVVHDELDFDNNSKYIFMFTGAKVVAGCCRMLVTSVGKNVERSKMMRSVRSIRKEEYSKLENAICKTNSRLEKIWLWLSLLILVVQVLRCFIWQAKYCDENHDDPDPKGVKDTVEEIMSEGTKLIKREGFRVKGLVGMLCVLLFAMRDGLPIGLFILLACVSKKIKKIYHAIVRNLSACATIGYVTTICIGEIEDLTMQHMKMAGLWIGLDNINQLGAEVDPEVLNALREAVCMNADSDFAEDSLILWARNFLGVSNIVLCNESFDLNCNCSSGVLLKRSRKVQNVVHMHYKGLPEIVLPMCSHYYQADGTMQTLDEQKREIFNQILERISSDSFRCFAFAYKHVVTQEKQEHGQEQDFEEQEADNGLTLLGLVGLKYPISPEVKKAVQSFEKFGVGIKLLVSEDIMTARLMALHSGIISPEEMIKGAVIEASEFRNSSEKDRMNMLDDIRVVANATPSDKLLMLQCLRQKGKVVAATGTSIRDTPLLKEADIGFFLGDTAAEMANENSDIIVMDRNFGTIFAILEMGRYVCKIVEKFVVLQLTLNISAFTINFLIVISTSVEPLTPFDLLWVNLIMDIFGALALAASMMGPPSSFSESNLVLYEEGAIVTKNMWRKIAVQYLYQVTVILVLNLKGKVILDVNERVLQAMIFNCFVICQLFLLIATRGMAKTFVSEGRFRVGNFCWFIGIVGGIVVIQVAVIQISMVIAGTGRLDIKQWSICVGVAAGSALIDGAAKWVDYVLTIISNLAYDLYVFSFQIM